MIKWYKYVQVIIHLTQKITTSGRHSVFYRCLVLFFLFGNHHHPPKVVVVCSTGSARWRSSSYLEIIILQKADGAHEQTGEDRLWLQLHQKACIIFHSMLVLYNIAASISKYGKNLRATESAWVDKRMCSDNQKGGASIENRTAYNYNCIRRPASSCPTFMPRLTSSARLLQVFQSTTITSIAWEHLNQLEWTRECAQTTRKEGQVWSKFDQVYVEF